MVLRIAAPSTLLWLAHSFHFLTCGPLVVIKQLKTKRKNSNLKSKTKKKKCQSKTKRKKNKIQKTQIKKIQTPNHPKIPEEIGGGCFYQKISLNISQNFYRHVTSPHWGHNTEIEGWKSITVSTYTFCIYRIIEIIISFYMIKHVKLKIMNNII